MYYVVLTTYVHMCVLYLCTMCITYCILRAMSHDVCIKSAPCIPGVTHTPDVLGGTIL